MTDDFTTDVLIVGAGAAGLTLAIDLARRGVAFRLIEKMAGPFQGSRGKGIQPRSQEVFEDLGVIDRLVARGGTYPLQRSYHADGGYDDNAILELGPATAAEPYHIALLVPQFLTEAVLRERLAELGQALSYGCELTSFEQDADSVTIRLKTPSGEETHRARYLIGADGGRSFVRGALGIGFPGETLGIRAVVADVRVTGASRDVWHRWGEGSRDQISLCPLAGTDMFQLQGPIPLEGDIDLSADGLTALLSKRTGRQDITITEVLWASAFNMNARLADAYRQGRVFLAGDAAHIHPPTGGQGLNTSIQDAYNLGWKLAAVLSGAPGDLLDTYEEERREVAAGVLGLSTKLLKAAEAGDNQRGREVHQLDIGYPHSSLQAHGSLTDRRIRAGDRAPDAPLTGSAGQTRRLFMLLAGPQWTLIGYQPGQGSGMAPRRGLHILRIGPQFELRDDQGAFKAAYGLSAGDWVLIRPDGYVAAVVDGAGLAHVETLLARVGLA